MITTLTRQKSQRTLKTFFPIIDWLPTYNGSYLRPDIIATLTVWALLVPEAITDIDATAIAAISELDDELARGGVNLRFARVKMHVLEIMRRGELEEKIGPDRFYISVQDGVDVYLGEQEQ